MRTYGQYCPVARAAEILAERWTPLVVRNLMFGAETFNDIARGVPLMSTSMLVTRLRELERAGVITRTDKLRGRGSRYLLTEAGRDLAGVIDGLGQWGERWAQIGPEHTDPGFALWAWSKVQLTQAALPSGRVVIAFSFPDQPMGNRYFWLLVEDGEAQVCTTDPGDEPALHVRCQSRAFIDWQRGTLSWARARREHLIELTGDRGLARALATWNERRTEPAVGTTVRG